MSIQFVILIHTSLEKRETTKVSTNIIAYSLGHSVGESLVACFY